MAHLQMMGTRTSPMKNCNRGSVHAIFVYTEDWITIARVEGILRENLRKRCVLETMC